MCTPSIVCCDLICTVRYEFISADTPTTYDQFQDLAGEGEMDDACDETNGAVEHEAVRQPTLVNGQARDAFARAHQVDDRSQQPHAVQRRRHDHKLNDIF